MSTLWLRNSLASLRLLLALTVVLGVGYPLVVLGIAQLPGLRGSADGSLVRLDGHTVGSRLIGQAFTDKDGKPLLQYFQSRPSAAGSSGYDPTATSASNLGPEAIVDAPGKPSLLTQVCGRSLAIGRLEGVSGARPYCTADGVGAVLAVFWSGPGYAGTITRVVSVNQTTGVPFLKEYRGVPVQLNSAGTDIGTAEIAAIRGDAPGRPAVPADAVTASASGLDPHISPAWAALQVRRVAHARGISEAQVQQLVRQYSDGRGLGFIGAPSVNVVELNRALDAKYPMH
jgi:K+-transporting ATPase ATPase C chain